MAEESKPANQGASENAEASQIVEAGKVSSWLKENDFEHEFMELDHLGVEIIKVDPEVLIPVATALYAYGFNYLQCQGGYDTGPGGDLVSFYHSKQGLLRYLYLFKVRIQTGGRFDSTSAYI